MQKKRLKTEKKKEQSISELYHKLKKPTIHVTGVPERGIWPKFFQI